MRLIYSIQVGPNNDATTSGAIYVDSNGVKVPLPINDKTINTLEEIQNARNHIINFFDNVISQVFVDAYIEAKEDI